jgi:hypothetical protein
MQIKTIPSPIISSEFDVITFFIFYIKVVKESLLRTLNQKIVHWSCFCFDFDLRRLGCLIGRRHDTQLNNIQQNDTQHNNKSNSTFSIMTLSITINQMPHSA